MMKMGWVLLIGLLPMMAVADTTVQAGDIEVKGRPVFDHNVYHGYAEYRFTVINHSPAQAHRVEVELVSLSRNSSLTKTIQVPARGRLGFSMFANRSKSQQTLSVTVDSRKEKSRTFSEIHANQSWNLRKTSLFASKATNQDELQQHIEKLRGWTTGSTAFENKYNIRRTDLPPQEWSENWLAYSSFDGIIIQSSDLEDLPPNVLAALQQYLESGGVLTIAGTTDCPFSGTTVQQIMTSSQKHTYAVGFGRCFAYAHAEPSEAKRSSWLKSDESAWRENTGVFYKMNQNEGAVNKIFTVVDQISIPVRGFLLLVTLFSLIAGPLTIFLLAKKNRRIWLLWVIPLESAITCALVLGYSFFSEGITPTVRLADLTILDQEQHRATTMGWMGYYCPQNPTEGLLFAEDRELFHVKKLNWRGASTGIDWTRGQHLTHGWVQARVPSFFMCRRSAIRRERLEYSLNTTDGKMEVVNGLGADITSLWLRDASGAFLFAEKINAGQRVTLELKSPEKGAEDLKKLRNLFLNDFSKAEFRLLDNPHSYMIPGSYVAVLDGSPFMEHGMGDKKINLQAQGIVYGILPTEVQP